jgi:hypothetical protein
MLDHLRFVKPDPAQFTPPRPESALLFPNAPTETRRTHVEEVARANA